MAVGETASVLGAGHQVSFAGPESSTLWGATIRLLLALVSPLQSKSDGKSHACSQVH